MDTIIMASRDVALCALVLLQLLATCLCYPGVRIHGGCRKLVQLPERARPNADVNANVLRSYLVHRDSLQTETKSRIERFLDAVKRSQSRVTRMQKTLQRTESEFVEADHSAVNGLHSAVSAGNGEYVMQVSLGTPPQRFTTIADTGSDLCWVQCSTCTHCFQQPDAVFNPTTSSSYSHANCTDPLCTALPRPSCSLRSETCSYVYGYGDGSNTNGDLAYETVTLGHSAVSHVGFGCGHNQAGTFAGADGLIGLGQGPLSLPSQLSPIVARIFAYCLVEQSGISTSSPITFGDAAENSAATYTPLLANARNPTYYYVGVTGISVGARRVPVPASAFRIDANGGGGVILDSGTTITYWRQAAFTPILAAFRRQIAYPEVNAAAYGLSLCYDISSVSAASVTLPEMVVHMTNVDYEIPVSNLFVLVDNSGQTACLAMGPSNQFSIIGNIQQQNNLIVHDVVNQRVGFQAFNCSTLT